jgi:hypothetical protein
MMSYSYVTWFFLLLLICGTAPSHNAVLGFLVTFGIVLTLILVNTMATTLTKLLLPDGPVKRGLLQLRGRHQ